MDVFDASAFLWENGSNYLEGPVTHGGLRSCFQTILKWLNGTLVACLAVGERREVFGSVDFVRLPNQMIEFHLEQ